MFESCCHCGAGVRRTPLRSRSTDRAGRGDRRKACGNPFPRPSSLRSRVNGCGNPSPSRILRILSCFALRMTEGFVIANDKAKALFLNKHLFYLSYNHIVQIAVIPFIKQRFIRKAAFLHFLNILLSAYNYKPRLVKIYRAVAE